MLTIKDIGFQIIKGTPMKFYVMCGTEFGIKQRYLELLEARYGGDKVEYESAGRFIQFMRQKRLIPLKPQLYVIRYDEAFVSELNDKTQSVIDKLQIEGTAVLLYEDVKHCKKLLKYLPDYAVSIDAVSTQFIRQYLIQEFPSTPVELVDTCVKCTDNYSQARNMCRVISYSPGSLEGMEEWEIGRLFGTNQLSSESQIRQAVAMRHTPLLLDILSMYQGTADSVFYTMLSTVLELEKLHCNSRTDSDIRKYVRSWTLKDIYNYFNNVYDALNLLRSSKAVDSSLLLTYLASLLSFREIPDGRYI